MNQAQLRGGLTTHIDTDIADAAFEGGDFKRPSHDPRVSGGLNDDVGALTPAHFVKQGIETVGVDHVVSSEPLCRFLSVRDGLDHDGERTQCLCSSGDCQTDWASPQHDQYVRSVHVANLHQGVVRDTKRLYQGAVGVVDGVGKLVKPRFLRLEELGGSSTNRETEVVVSDDALPHDAVAGLQIFDLRAHLHHFTRPFVARDQRILKGDDVAALE